MTEYQEIILKNAIIAHIVLNKTKQKQEFILSYI